MERIDADFFGFIALSCRAANVGALRPPTAIMWGAIVYTTTP